MDPACGPVPTAPACSSELAPASNNQGACEEADAFVCGVCLATVTDNLQCRRCRNIYCNDCLKGWLKSSTSHSCPTCRNEDLGDLFVHNPELEATIASKPYTCEHNCGASMLWGAKREHSKKCENFPLTCPYQGCGASLPRGEMDKHTFGCAYSKQYSAGTILSRIAALSLEHASQDEAELYAAFMREKPQDTHREAPSGTSVHIVQEHDTLAGIAVRYGTTKERIRQLNHLGSDIIFGHNSLLVPQTDVKNCDPPVDPPAEVVLALHRKRLARQVMASTQLPSEEAIAYLKLALYNVANAVAQHRADTEWARGHMFKPARSLKEFLTQSAERNLHHCHHCAAALDDKRQHCPKCGLVLCRVCITMGGHFLHTIPRSLLGVTSPSRNEQVAVCKDCTVSVKAL